MAKIIYLSWNPYRYLKLLYLSRNLYRKNLNVLLQILINMEHFEICIKSVALQLRRAKSDWSGCCQLAVQGALWLAKRLSLNLNFSFLNWISLLLISSSYPIVLTRLGGPRSRPYTSRKNFRVEPGIEPGTSWMQSDVLTTVPNRWSWNLHIKINL